MSDKKKPERVVEWRAHDLTNDKPIVSFRIKTSDTDAEVGIKAVGAKELFGLDKLLADEIRRVKGRHTFGLYIKDLTLDRSVGGAIFFDGSVSTVASVRFQLQQMLDDYAKTHKTEILNRIEKAVRRGANIADACAEHVPRFRQWKRAEQDAYVKRTDNTLRARKKPSRGKQKRTPTKS